MSRARLDLTMAERDELLRASIRNNEGAAITGLLLCDGHQFLQAFEGSDAAVNACWNRIQNDDRHFDLVLHENEVVESRQFGDWAMNCRSTLHLSIDQFRTDVYKDVAAVTNMRLKALFIGFASLAR